MREWLKNPSAKKSSPIRVRAIENFYAYTDNQIVFLMASGRNYSWEFHNREDRDNYLEILLSRAEKGEIG